MEESLDIIINTFHKYSVRRGDRDTLNRKKFKQFMIEEMPKSFKKEEEKEKIINDMMKEVDTNYDGQVDFNEFVALIGNILKTKHEESHENASSSVHGQGSSNGPNL
ncbi:protein S100-A9-like [Mastomys coucha]|uniref:protein S100-A9-like n=1 Tax=Mastomys coucha TaxID=35658 RepID=UPI00126245F8|nr:protein S100-A9-like [Mastomys coucha]